MTTIIRKKEEVEEKEEEEKRTKWVGNMRFSIVKVDIKESIS